MRVFSVSSHKYFENFLSSHQNSLTVLVFVFLPLHGLFTPQRLLYFCSTCFSFLHSSLYSSCHFLWSYFLSSRNLQPLSSRYVILVVREALLWLPFPWLTWYLFHLWVFPCPLHSPCSSVLSSISFISTVCRFHIFRESVVVPHNSFLHPVCQGSKNLCASSLISTVC